jgi:hypothetical protein
MSLWFLFVRMETFPDSRKDNRTDKKFLTFGIEYIKFEMSQAIQQQFGLIYY